VLLVGWVKWGGFTELRDKSYLYYSNSRCSIWIQWHCSPATIFHSLHAHFRNVG